ncbi:hypothetical protein DRA42_00055 [Ethanoligenens harbinense]|nr:hypothetical protein CXQ68_00045 [Ethanoligenens harbinense YUAN-3]AYF37470.1 hypothetical protein CXP51_00045 [Ethanoligenens harbinense]QCN91025.1 hypothetical protein DRA42_00055 [Ethanoligenens harbinense]
MPPSAIIRQANRQNQHKLVKIRRIFFLFSIAHPKTAGKKSPAAGVDKQCKTVYYKHTYYKCTYK